jgi:hypothetical protein
VNLPELRNVPYPGSQYDLDLCAMFSSDAGKRVMANWEDRTVPLVFLLSEIKMAVARVHAHCGTGELRPG